jgi:hypothetical protein
MDATSTVTGVTACGESSEHGYESWAQNEAVRLFSALGSWQQVADDLAPFLRRSPSAWWSVAEGHKLTTPKVNALLRHAGKPMIPAPVEVMPCPTCGGVHVAGDCHGRPVVAVVTLAPGEVVRRNGHAPTQTRKPDARATLHLPAELRDRINARRGDMTQAEYIEQALVAYDLLEDA